MKGLRHGWGWFLAALTGACSSPEHLESWADASASSPPAARLVVSVQTKDAYLQRTCESHARSLMQSAANLAVQSVGDLIPEDGRADSGAVVDAIVASKAELVLVILLEDATRANPQNFVYMIQPGDPSESSLQFALRLSKTHKSALGFFPETHFDVQLFDTRHQATTTWVGDASVGITDGVDGLRSFDRLVTEIVHDLASRRIIELRKEARGGDAAWNAGDRADTAGATPDLPVLKW